MKRNLLSVLIPALLVVGAGAVNAAEVYNKDGNKLDLNGQVHGLYYFGDHENNSDDDGDQSFVRLGIKGETQISSQLTGYGKWEYQFDAHHPEGGQSGKTRYAYAGLSFAKVGSLDYGRNDGVVYNVTSYTDVLPEFGADTYGQDNFMQARSNGVLTYRNKDFFGLVDGLNFALQYQGRNDKDRKAMEQNGDGFSASVTYDSPIGLSIGGALSTAKRTDDQQNPLPSSFGHGDRAETYSVAVKYDANNLYLAAQYTQSYNATFIGSAEDNHGFANKANNLELVAKYDFDFGLSPSIAYLQSRGQDIEGYGSEDLLKYVDVGLNYDFNKNMSAYVDYKINLLKKNDFITTAGIPTNNIVGVGIVYQF